MFVICFLFRECYTICSTMPFIHATDTAKRQKKTTIIDDVNGMTLFENEYLFCGDIYIDINIHTFSVLNIIIHSSFNIKVIIKV